MPSRGCFHEKVSLCGGVEDFLRPRLSSPERSRFCCRKWACSSRFSLHWINANASFSLATTLDGVTSLALLDEMLRAYGGGGARNCFFAITHGGGYA